MPQFTVDGHRPVGAFDLLGVSFSTELGYTNLLTALDLAGIPLHSDDRDPADGTWYPLVIAGGHAAFNPEPVADFLDPVLIKVVRLDQPCREQQVHDGCFHALDEVPTHAYTLTVPALLKAPTVTVVVPARDEADNVGPCLLSLAAQDYPRPSLAIIAVDDGSTDGTREKLQSMPLADDVTVLFHERNCGKGAAIRTALQRARGEYVLIQDSDLEYDPQDYPALLRPLEQRWLKKLAERRGARDARLDDFGWWLEELRVGLFAQELKTPQPVSAKRLDKIWAQAVS